MYIQRAVMPAEIKQMDDPIDKQKTKKSAAGSKHINGSAGAAHHQCNRCKIIKAENAAIRLPIPYNCLFSPFSRVFL